MAQERFTSVCSVEEFILRARKEKKYLCKIAWKIFENEGQRRKVEAISAVELNEYISQFITHNTRIDYFTVVGLVTWPLNGSEAGVDLVLIQTSLFLLCKSSCSYANQFAFT